MFSKLNNPFDTPQPIKFISPLPIAECTKRLEESIGKPMGCLYTVTKGKIEKVDDTTYKFVLYQDYLGGHKITGHLFAQTESNTLIDALHTVDRSRWWMGILFVAILIVVIFIEVAPKQGIVTALGLSAILLAMTGSILLVSLKAQPLSQLLWWFEHTLKQ